MRHGLFLSACVFLGCVSAHAATTTINFNNLPGPNDAVLTPYTESGFTVANSPANTAAVFRYSINGAGETGNPAPDIYTFGPASALVTDAGSLFTFQSVDLGTYGAGILSYTITGILNGNSVFSQSQSLLSGATQFHTISSLYGGVNIDTLQIALAAAVTGRDVDNIVLGSPVAVTPEPSSLMLLGTGLLGVAGLVKRRLA